jgi:hypothetical protein
MKKLFALFMVCWLCLPTFALQETEESTSPEEAIEATEPTETPAPEEKAQPEPETVTIPAKTWFDVELMEHLSGVYNLRLGKIRFRVMEDVVVEDHVVIAKGTYVSGRVGSTEKATMLGRGGNIDFSIKETTAVDGTKVPLKHSVSKKGYGVEKTVVYAGFFLRGEQGFVLRGTIYEAIVRRDTVVTIQDKTAEESTGEEILEADFECAEDHLSFNLGKKRKLKPVTVYLKHPAEDVKQVALYQVNDYALDPSEPVRATGQERQRDGSLALQFERWDILRFLPDGQSTLVFRGETTDGKIFEGSDSVTLKLKATWRF